MATILIPLPRGKHAEIDIEDEQAVLCHEWHVREARTTWYAYTYIGEKIVPMQNLICHTPPGMVVDHKDRDGLNNRRDNLRPATSQQNVWNRGKPRNSKAPYKGVSYMRDKKKWVAQYKEGTKNIIIGRYATALEAAIAYDTRVREARGEFAVLNFPDTHER